MRTRAAVAGWWAIPAFVVLALMTPMVVQTKTYGGDWPNHLWLVHQQGLNIQDLGRPSLYVQSSLGVHLPWFAFYGGTLYALVGGLGALLGMRSLVAYVACYALLVAAAYAGCSWIARQCGLRGWTAHVPGALYVTSAYYVTNAYGRGAFAETAATSAIPVVLAAGMHLLRSERASPPAILALLAGIVVMSGSHSITLVWGSVFLFAVVAVALAVQRRLPPPARMLRVSSVVALGLAVNAWFLLPLAANASRTQIAAQPAAMQYTDLSSPSSVLSLRRHATQPDGGRGTKVNAQLPILAIAWAAGTLALCAAGGRGTWRRWGLGLGALLALFTWLTLSPSAVEALPGPLDRLQFPYRISTYATLCAIGLALAALVAARTLPVARRRVVLGAVVVVSLIGFGQAMAQILDAPSSSQRDLAFGTSPNHAPVTWYAPLDYADASAPQVSPSVPAPLIVPVDGPKRERYSVPVEIPREEIMATNIAAGPYLVDVEGAAPVGRTPHGTMVVRVPSGRRTVSVSAKDSAAVRIGSAISIVAVAVIGLGLLAVPARAVARRARRRSP